MFLTQQQADHALGQDVLIHKKIVFFVIPTPDSDLRTLSSSPRIYFCGYVLLIGSMKLVAFTIHFHEFLTASAGREIFSFILSQPTLAGTTKIKNACLLDGSPD